MSMPQMADFHNLLALRYFAVFGWDTLLLKGQSLNSLRGEMVTGTNKVAPSGVVNGK
jgi:hypothetical protein